MIKGLPDGRNLLKADIIRRMGIKDDQVERPISRVDELGH
jgi:hypothetical protein